MDVRDHAFFECFFSHKVWVALLKRCLVTKPIGDWNSELTWLSRSLKRKVCNKVSVSLLCLE
jgi:hypothetical protein